MVASALVVMILTAVTAILSMAGTMQQVVTLQTDADQGAVKAMNRMILEVREAKEVAIPSDTTFTVYLPVIRADGHYDRFVTDYNNWIKYHRSTSNGTASSTGTYASLACYSRWSQQVAGDGCQELPRHPELHQLHPTDGRVGKGKRLPKGDTQLTERVLYLRNN